MSDPLRSKVEMLERTVLELGTSFYDLKGSVARSRESHDHLLGVIKSLKHLLDEKGLIDRDDFDAAIELGTASRNIEERPEPAEPLLKKGGH